MTDTPKTGVKYSAGYSRYVLGVLFLVYVFNFIDRQILGILLEDIKADLGVSDTAMGFLAGFAFVIFYTVAGIPIARLADHASRRSIIAVGLVLWSLATTASGFARNFLQLALARVAVGVGEAAGSPPAHSLLSDYFPPERRATALSIYAAGVYVGAMLAFLAGGFIKDILGWRAAFFVVGIPGILLALIVRFTVAEPKRGQSEKQSLDTTPVSTGDVIRYLKSCPPFLFMVSASAIQSLSGYSILVWGPAFFSRVHGMSSSEIGIGLGIIIGIAGCLGGYFGGRLADHMGQRDARWYMRLPAIQSLIAAPMIIAVTLADSGSMALFWFAPFYAIGAMYVGPMHSMGQSLVKLRMRATASAILLFIVNMVGLGLAPLVVGFLNDQVFVRFGSEAIRYSLLVMGLAGGCASIFFWLASRRLPEFLDRAQQVESTQLKQNIT